MATPKEIGLRPQPQYGGSSPIRSVYDAAVEQQAGDYDDIMGGYSSLAERARSGAGNNPIQFNPITPSTRQFIQGQGYNRSQDLGKLIGDLQGFSTTGGYSDDDVSSIRERGLSPIRAIYANAQRDANRQKNLSGGYSPNAGAVNAKMAREQSSLLGDASTKINAQVAQMIQSGKLAGYNQLSPLLGRENDLINQITQRNTDAQRDVDLWNAGETNRANEFNTNMGQRTQEFNANQNNQNDALELSSLQGKQSLYGTTPALTSMFGNQVLQNNQQNMQAVQTANQIKNQRAGIGLNIVNQAQQNNAGRGGVQARAY
jgi:hypothetical protein